MVSLCESGGDLYTAAEVVTDGDRGKLPNTIADNPGPQTFRAEEQRIARDSFSVGGRRQFKVYEDVSSGKQLPVRIIDVYLNIQRTARLIHGA